MQPRKVIGVEAFVDVRRDGAARFQLYDQHPAQLRHAQHGAHALDQRHGGGKGLLFFQKIYAAQIVEIQLRRKAQRTPYENALRVRVRRARIALADGDPVPQSGVRFELGDQRLDIEMAEQFKVRAQGNLLIEQTDLSQRLSVFRQMVFLAQPLHVQRF